VDRDAMLAIGATINAHWGAPAGGQEGVPGNAPPLDAPGSAPAADKLFQLNEKTLIRPAATDEKAVPPEGAP
ncbi:MAG TPA: hypothetical protein VLN73_01090, partial [Alphaproteobacteria bacterium]|nr:hypothetical protein [Alphaproteobacteria bacterium]